MAKKKNKCSLDEISDGNKEILLDILAREGVETVTVRFDGGGDDGQIETSDLPSEVASIVVEGSRVSQGAVWSAGINTVRWKENCRVGEIVDSICYQALEMLYGGWENNDGAFGEFVFNVKDRTISLDFNARYVESELFQHQF